MEYFNAILIFIILIFLFLLLLLGSILFFIPELANSVEKRIGEKSMLQLIFISLLFAIGGLSIISFLHNRSLLNFLWFMPMVPIFCFIYINKNVKTYKTLRNGDVVDLMKLFRLINKNFKIKGSAITFYKYALQSPTYFYDKKINWNEQINGKESSYRPFFVLHILIHDIKSSTDIYAKEFYQYTSQYFTNLSPSSQVFSDFRKKTSGQKVEEINKTVYQIFTDSKIYKSTQVDTE